MAGISAEYARTVSLTRSACRECETHLCAEIPTCALRCPPVCSDTHPTDEDGLSHLILRLKVNLRGNDGGPITVGLLVPKARVTGEAGTDPPFITLV